MKKKEIILIHSNECYEKKTICETLREQFSSINQALNFVKKYYIDEVGLDEKNDDDMEYLNDIINQLSTNHQWQFEDETWIIKNK